MNRNDLNFFCRNRIRFVPILTVMLVYFFSATYGQKPHELKKEKAFGENESLTYLLHWGPLEGGLANTMVRTTTYKGKEVYYGRVLAKTTGIADALFKVKDIYSSYFDRETLLPYKAIRDIHEGSYTYYNEVDFFHGKKMVYSQKSGEHEVPDGILDMVSTLYYLRSMDFSGLRDGDVIKIITYFGDEIFPFDFRYRGRENIKTQLGKFRCYKFVPIVEPGRMFESEDDMIVWITADKNQVPIRVQLDMLVGSVRCDLMLHSGLKYDLKPLD